MHLGLGLGVLEVGLGEVAGFHAFGAGGACCCWGDVLGLTLGCGGFGGGAAATSAGDIAPAAEKVNL